MIVAEFIIKQLAEWGVKRIYGVTGDSIFPLMEALGKQEQIQFILTAHESAAAMMASAEAKLTGRPGVCLATSGPGLANLINGLADAAEDKVPVIAITGQVPSDKIGSGYKQYIDQSSFIRPVAIYTAQVSHPNGVFSILSQALKSAVSQNGVSHLSLPKDIGDLPTDNKIKPYPAYLEQKPQVLDKNVDQAVQIIDNSQRPLILMGLGAENAGTQITSLAEKINSGIILSLGAKGILPDSHTLVLGGIGSGGSQESADLLFQSDLLIMVGATWYPHKYVPQDIKVVQVDIHPNHVSQDKELACVINGKAEEVIDRIIPRIKSKLNADWKELIKSSHNNHINKLINEKNQAGSPVAPQHLIGQLEELVEDNAIITVDTGDHTIWFNRLFQGKRQKVLFSGSWRTMGFAVPAAIAAKKLYPDRQVVALTGDGGMMMNLGEIVTAVREKVNIQVVVFHNQSFAMERNKMIMEGRTPFGVDLSTPDFSQWAIACGARGLKVMDSSELQKALKSAFTSNQTSLVDVMCSVPFPESTKPNPSGNRLLEKEKDFQPVI